MVSRLKSLLIPKNFYIFHKYVVLKKTKLLLLNTSTLNFSCSSAILSACERFDNYDTEERDHHFVDYNTYTLGDETGKKCIIDIFTKQLECSQEEAKILITENKSLVTAGPLNISTNLEFLKNSRFTPNVLKQYPHMLCLPISTLKSRMTLISKLNLIDNSVSIPFFDINTNYLQKMCAVAQKEEEEPEGNRVKFFISKLDCDGVKVCEMFAYNYFMMNRVYSELRESLLMLLDAKVSADDIVRDAWIFQYRPTALKARIDILKQANITGVKPWFLRCSYSRFEETLRERLYIQELLGNKTFLEFIAMKFDCNLNVAEIIYEKCPAIMKMSPAKIDEMLNLLYASGFTSEQVQFSPQILCHSVEKIKCRLQELKSLEHSPTLMTLCRTRKQYLEFIKKLRANKESQSDL